MVLYFSILPHLYFFKFLNFGTVISERVKLVPGAVECRGFFEKRTKRSAAQNRF